MRTHALFPSLLALLLFAGIPLTARAANPRVSLKVEKATAREAAAALSKASGVPLEIRPYPTLPGRTLPMLPDLNERATFDWTDVTFARALRDLSERYHLGGRASAGGWVLDQMGLP